MWYIYILESESQSGKFYTGFTEDCSQNIMLTGILGTLQNINRGNYMPILRSVIKRPRKILKRI